VILPEPGSDEAAEGWLEAASLLKKLRPDDHEPPLPDDDPRDKQGAPACWCNATLGRGAQFSPGISA
jgi:hypothetical protein